MATKILLIGVDPQRKLNVGTEVAAVLEAEGYTVKAPDYIDFDITSHVQVEEFQMREYQHLILCNGWLKVAPIEEQDHYDIKKAINNNLLGNLMMISRFVQETKANTSNKDPRRIINIGSFAAEHPHRWLAPYCAAKAGLNHAVRCLARELHPDGYRIFCINPGKIEGTPMQKKIVQNMKDMGHDQAESFYDDRRLMPRWQTPADIADVIFKIIDGELDWMSGGSIPLSGGPQ